MYNRLNRAVVEYFWLMETGSYNQQFRRPYETNITPQLLVEVQNSVGQHGTISPSMLAGVAGSIITPQAAPEAAAPIYNGWETKRLSFVLVVVITNPLGAPVREYILGYTDHCGVAGMQHAIDPNMIFVINSVVKTRDTVLNDHMGNPYVQSSIVSVNQILSDLNFQGLKMNQGPGERMLRPQDVFQTMGSSMIRDGGYGAQHEGFVDARTLLTGAPAISSRHNNNSSHYMARIMDAWRLGQMEKDAPNEAALQMAATGFARETAMNTMDFLTQLGSITGNVSSTTFRFGDLAQLDPQVGEKMTIQLQSPAQKTQTHQAGMTETFQGVSYATHAVTILANGVPPLMVANTLNVVHLQATNRTMNGMIEVQVLDVKSFINADVSQFISNFIGRMQADLLPTISSGNQVDFALNLKMNIFGESWISISFQGEPAVDYVIPSFADTAITPVVTSTTTRQDQIAFDIGNLLDNTMPMTHDFVNTNIHTTI
jgi:hypothetical protein